MQPHRLSGRFSSRRLARSLFRARPAGFAPCACLIRLVLVAATTRVEGAARHVHNRTDDTGEAVFLHGPDQAAPNAFAFVVDAESDEYWSQSSGAADMYACVVAAQVAALRSAGHSPEAVDIVVGVSKSPNGHAVAAKLSRLKLGVRIFASTIERWYSPRRTFGVDTEEEAAALATGTEATPKVITFNFFRANMLKMMLLSLYTYDSIAFMDLDYFPAGKAKEFPFATKMRTHKSLQSIGRCSPGSPFSGAEFVMRPTRQAFGRMLGLLKGGFDTVLGWGKGGKTLPASPKLGGFALYRQRKIWQHMAWANTGCAKIPQYCSRTKGASFREWSFFGGGADQGILYTTFAYEPNGFKALSMTEWNQMMPAVHFSGSQNKPWALHVSKEAHVNIKIFRKAWKSAMGSFGHQLAQNLTCTAALNSRYQ